MHVIPALKDCVATSHLVESSRYQCLGTPSVCIYQYSCYRPDGHRQTRIHALPFTLRLAVLFRSHRLHILARWRNRRRSRTWL